MNIKVLMITGVYYPEINGAVLQCRQLIDSLKGTITATVLTGTNEKKPNNQKKFENIKIIRIYLPKKNTIYYLWGLIKFIIYAIKLIKVNDIVHLHGFSRRNSVVVLIAIILRKKIILKMTSFGHDDPVSIQKNNKIIWFIYKKCQVYIGISPAFGESYNSVGLLKSKYKFIPNCVDINKYSPPTKIEKNELRLKYGFLIDDNIIIFIGHFSQEKRPYLLYQAWLELQLNNIHSKIIFIGRTKGNYEIDEEILHKIKCDALKHGFLDYIYFIEKSDYIFEYLKLSDVFVLPSIREGLPNVLLEAMSCALPCLVTNLNGVTDWLIEDGVTGELIYSNDPNELAMKINRQLRNKFFYNEIGIAARKIVINKFSNEIIVKKIKQLYIEQVKVNE